MSAKKSELVVKSNRLIEASYRLGLVEQQIILYAICRSREEQKGLNTIDPVTIRADKFAEQFGTNPNQVYTQLKQAMETLYARSVTIHDIHPESGKPRVTEARWLSEKSYVDGAGVIELIFSARVIPFITRLGEDGEFTQYRLEKIGGMSSAYAIRLYELLVQYLSIGHRNIEIAWLKEVLQIEDEYPRILDLKKRVIDVAVKQINEHSDIEVSYQQHKTGRNITRLDFTIRDKAPKTPKKRPPVDEAYVNKHAKPGETTAAATKRLKKEPHKETA